MIRCLLQAVTLSVTLAAALQQRSDCVAECAHLESHRAFETCVAECSKLPRKDNVPDVAYYPTPPKNVSIDTAVVIDNGKFLETTVTWSSTKDLGRTGFYLRYSAIGEQCQRDFPGYFASNIGPRSSGGHHGFGMDCTMDVHGRPTFVRDSARFPEDY